MLVAPWKFPRLRLKHHVFLMNVAAADSGLIATPILLATVLMSKKGFQLLSVCALRLTIDYTCMVASSLLLLASSIERCVAIQHPLLHGNTCSGKTLAISCGVILGLLLGDENVAVFGVEQLVTRRRLLLGPRDSVSPDDVYLQQGVVSDDY